MTTLRQKQTANIMAEKIKEKKPLIAGKILIEAGYSKSIARRPESVFKSKGFQEYLNSIDDTAIIEKWRKWALADTDKRVALQAGENIMKLKDRYPAGKLKLGAFEERDKVIE